MGRVGVLGSLVWDTVIPWPPGSPPVEAWGGAAWALAGFNAALVDPWRLIPLIKVGADLADAASALLASHARSDGGARALRVVPWRTNRVTLRYTDPFEREEHQRCEIPPWTFEELAPVLPNLDALYINFLSGFELELETAEALRARFDRPIYADLHSLTLGVEPDGRRFLRLPPEAGRWLRCFDTLQVNAAEAALFGAAPGGILGAGRDAGVRRVVLTRGPDGASLYERAAGGAWRAWHVAAIPLDGALDPTGCGDVFGAALLATLLAGREPDAALARATRFAAETARCSGAHGLAARLTALVDQDA